MADVNNLNEVWYTKEHLIASILDYLKENGFKTYKEETNLSGIPETLLFAFGNGKKEIIEIKGYSQDVTSPRHQLLKSASPDHFMHWFPDTLFSSLISLVRQYKNEKLPVALCLPDLMRYREIIEKVIEYFTDNNLHHKIYLVKQSGRVTVLNLNRRIENSGTETGNKDEETL